MNLGRPVCLDRTSLRCRLPLRLTGLTLMGLALCARAVSAQRVVTQAERVISVSKGASALLINPVPLSRFSVGDPNIAEATVLSPTEVLINGKGLGTTTLFIWDNTGQVRVNSVEVTADAPGLQRFLKQRALRTIYARTPQESLNGYRRVNADLYKEEQTDLENFHRDQVEGEAATGVRASSARPAGSPSDQSVSPEAETILKRSLDNESCVSNCPVGVERSAFG